MTAHLGANTVNDVFDFQSGTDQAARAGEREGTSVASGSTMLLSGQLRPAAYWRLTILLFAIALVCGLILTIFRPSVLAFAVAGFLLAFFYVAPPIRYGYIGRGLGEGGIFLAFGVLPLVGAYYVQTGVVTPMPVAAAVPIGLFTTAILFFHHFLHWRADRASGKMTPVAVLGVEWARFVGLILLLAVPLAIIVDSLVGIFPWYALVAVLPILPPLRALLATDGTLPKYGALMGQALLGNLLSGLILLTTTIIGGTLH